jgi:hypothetical protein
VPDTQNRSLLDAADYLNAIVDEVGRPLNTVIPKSASAVTVPPGHEGKRSARRSNSLRDGCCGDGILGGDVQRYFIQLTARIPGPNDLSHFEP